MTKQKLELILKITQYAIDHYKIINEDLVYDILNSGHKMLNDICSETCGGVYHCLDGCPIYYLMEDECKITS